ncbi:MAG: SIR2 family protein [Oscillospiraceae bacterium]|nr:SIR2 family protein [Oscillospiraceae bacterium]
MKIRKPQILLLGNGINRAFKSDSWDDLLNSIDRRGDKYEIDGYRCPETLKAILVTEDNVDKALKKQKNSLGNLGTEESEKQIQLLQRLLNLGFDEILTTNFSYELETAALGHGKVNERSLRHMQRHTEEVSRCETSLMLHTYNRVEFGGAERRIWHIHGEARKPDSMILGAYYYGNLLGKMIDLNKKRGKYYAAARKAGETPKIRSWTDAFILGDVYILGFGFGFAESDLWWLLNRKKREPGVGRTYFYELKPQSDINRAKLDLLQLMNVRIVYKTVSGGDWQSAYERAVDDIAKKTNK